MHFLLAALTQVLCEQNSEQHVYYAWIKKVEKERFIEKVYYHFIYSLVESRTF